MKWTIKSSWTYDKNGSIDLVMDLIKREEKYGKIIGLKIERLRWPIQVWKDKTKWLVIQMTGTKEQKDECDEFLLQKMNG